ncbi:MAG: MoaD/ThiS family protein [Gemmatimonadetes bacterium]|nr:MoaD/ThiS family protein [Gemmatimonadota bacterium]
MPTVTLPSPLVDRAGGLRQLDVPSGTALEVIRRLEVQHAGLRGWILDEQGRLREHVKLFVNDAEASLDTALSDGDELHIVPAISGGAGRARRGGSERARSRREPRRRRLGGRRGTTRAQSGRRGAAKRRSKPRRSARRRSGGKRSVPARTATLPASRPSRAERAELLVGTRKGLIVLRGPRGGPMKVVARAFPGLPVEFATRDPRTGTYLASVTHWQFGPHVFLTNDPAGEWQQADGPAFPPDAGAAVSRIWVIEPGVEPGVLWAGAAPAAFFKSTDAGRTWTLNRALWDQPTRPQWEAGAGGLCLHSICTWPGDPKRLAVGISAAGVWITDDGGESWRWGVHGLVPRYVPEEARANTLAYCVHSLQRARLRPATLYMQFHGGVYRSDDAGETWIDIGTDRGLPSDFGFPIAVDPHDPDRAFVIPLVRDEDRVTPQGKLRIYETRDGGQHWRARAKGLPQQNAYLTILRQAFCTDANAPLGLYFGAESGELFGSADAGRTWSTFAEHLPPILSVRCSR